MIRTILRGPLLALAAGTLFFATVPAYAECHLAPLKTYLDCPPQTEMIQMDLQGTTPEAPKELTTQPSQPAAETVPPESKGARDSR